MDNEFDVAIVGGGPAGITAAATLGKKGYSVIVLEAAVYPGAENWSGTVYFGENLVHPEAFGADLFDHAPYERKLVKRGFSLYDGVSQFGGSYRNPNTFENCYTVLRPIFDHYLSERVKEWGVSVLPETTVQSLIYENDRVIGCQTERGPVYADCVFLAEGDASHLTTQEGYEQVEDDRPEFLQGIKEVIQLPPEVIQERFDVQPGEGSASEVLVRNGNIGGETARLNMGGFIYTNRESVSIGLVLPVHNLKHEFNGDHNDLMEWFKGLPEIQNLLQGGELSSFGTKVIRGGGYNEIPQIVDHGLAIGGAATGIGIDFPYPNFTGPATRMGLLFGQAYHRIQEKSLQPDRETLKEHYHDPLKETHYYKNVQYLRDFPSYVEKTRIFFGRQIDLISGTASIATDPDQLPGQKLRTWVRYVRSLLSGGRWREILADRKQLLSIFQLPQQVWANIDAGMLGNWLCNSFQSLLPGSPYPAVDPGELQLTVRTGRGNPSTEDVPVLFRWLEQRFHEPLKKALNEVYKNDDTPIRRKIKRATQSMMSALSFLDLLLVLPALVLIGFLLVTETVKDYISFRVMNQDVSEFLDRPEQQYLRKRRERGNMKQEEETVTKDRKLGTISYTDTERSNIKVFWPDDLRNRKELESSPLWHVCPARVYDVHEQFLGNPGVVVNFENCIKCETCWRATEDVHWSRATEHRMIYETYSSAHDDLANYLRSRSVPRRKLPASTSDEASDWITRQTDVIDGYCEDRRLQADDETIKKIEEIPANLKRLRLRIDTLPAHLDDLPPVLEQGRTRWFMKHVQSIERIADEIDLVLKGQTLLELRRDLQRTDRKTLFSVWEDLLKQIQRMKSAMEDQKPHWVSLIGDQLLEHHLPQFEQALQPLLSLQNIQNHSRILPEAFEGIHSSPDVFAERQDSWRQNVRSRLDEAFDHQSVKRFDRNSTFSDDQKQVLRDLVNGLPLQQRIKHPRSRILIEELGRRDPSLSWLISHHLWGLQILRNHCEVPDRELEPFYLAKQWLAVSAQHDIQITTIQDQEDNVVSLTGTAEFVPTALADHFVVIGEQHVALLDTEKDAVSIVQENPCGLKGCRPSKLQLDQTRTNSVWDTTPNGQEPIWSEHLQCLDPLFTDMIRGASHYLRKRGKEHADSRVQFPGQFQDEAGKDTIAKFGAVKEMLADIEEQYLTIETLSTLSAEQLCPSSPTVGRAAKRCVSATCFGPELGSISYNTGQIFGGTAFSEDDFISKFYRDSSVTRFLITDPDQLLQWIGDRWMDETTPFSSFLSDPSDLHRTLYQHISDEPLMSDVYDRFQNARSDLESYVNDIRSLEDSPGQRTRIELGKRLSEFLAVRGLLLRTYVMTVKGSNTELESQACEKSCMDLQTNLQTSRDRLNRRALTQVTGKKLLNYGPLEPVPDLDPPSYETFLQSDQTHQSGQSLVNPYDPSILFHSPEIAGGDASLHEFADALEQEVRDKYYSETYTEGNFDGLCYPRYLEKIHTLPDEDLSYLLEKGYMRIPIDEEYGGEGHLKATYYQLCDTFMRHADPAMALCIMVNTSIGTTPIQLGLKQDLPDARNELSNLLDQPDQLTEIKSRIESIIGQLDSPDIQKLTSDFEECEELVRERVRNTGVLKYIAGQFLRSFYEAAQAGQNRDLEGFESHLKEALEQFQHVESDIQQKLDEYDYREEAHKRHLNMISAGWVSAFALTEPTAGSDSGGVKTRASLQKRRVYRDQNDLPYFFLNEEEQKERRRVLDASRLTFDSDTLETRYLWSEEQSVKLRFDRYDYETDQPDGKVRYLEVDGTTYEFHDIARLRTDENGNEWYEYYELNGSKMWITNGRFARMFNLYARTEEGVTGFMVDRHAEGLVVGQDEEKMGQKGSPTNELSLKDVRVPRENVIGILGRGQVNALESLNAGRIGLAYCSAGIMKDIVERGTRYVHDQNTDEWKSTEQVEELFGHVAENIMGTESLAYNLVGYVDHHGTDSIRMESAIGKYFASEAVHESIRCGEHLRGLKSQTDRHDIEKKRRDARVITIYEGTNEVQRFLLLKDLVQNIHEDELTTPYDNADPDSSNYPELLRNIQNCREDFHDRLDASVDRFNDQVWKQVSYQPVFFRLSEMAGLLKLAYSTLQRMDLVQKQSQGKQSNYTDLIDHAGRLFIQRSLSELRTRSKQFDRRFKFLTNNRYPPQVQLGFQSLENRPSRKKSSNSAELDVDLSESIQISVPIKPVPKTAPEPRLEEGTFIEPLLEMNPADRTALDEALRIKSRQPDLIDVSAVLVYSDPDSRHEAILQKAIALGADRAKTIEISGSAFASSESVARALNQAYGSVISSPDLLFLGNKSIDTGQGATGPSLGALLNLPHYNDVEQFEGLHHAGDDMTWTISFTHQSQSSLNDAGRGVFCFERREPTDDYTIQDTVRGWSSNIERLTVSNDRPSFEVTFHKRERTGETTKETVAKNSASAAETFLEHIDQEQSFDADSGDSTFDHGKIPDPLSAREDAALGIFVAPPIVERGTTPSAEQLSAARYVCSQQELSLGLLLPSNGESDVLQNTLNRIVEFGAPEILLYEDPDLLSYSWHDYLRLFTYITGALESPPELWMGPDEFNDVFCRLQVHFSRDHDHEMPQSPVSWLNTDMISRQNGTFDLRTTVLENRVEASAHLPSDHPQLMTFQNEVRSPESAYHDSDTQPRPDLYRIDQLSDRESAGTHPPLFTPVDEHGSLDDLDQARMIIDVGYGVGDAEGMKTVVDPLKTLLEQELELDGVMVGATRKVTQDLELLPDDRQIGQTGTRVEPEILFALGVSGAPQHIDYIGERTTIFSFNIDEDAPLMTLNEDRPAPLVHPIHGDLFETVPRFIEEVQSRL